MGLSDSASRFYDNTLRGREKKSDGENWPEIIAPSTVAPVNNRDTSLAFRLLLISMGSHALWTNPHPEN